MKPGECSCGHYDLQHVHGHCSICNCQTTEVAIRALTASVDAACRAGLGAGLSVEQVQFVLTGFLARERLRALQRIASARRSLLTPQFGERHSEEAFCDHCNRETVHDVIDSTHERDSSGDWRECSVCLWTYSGFDGKYHAP